MQSENNNLDIINPDLLPPQVRWLVGLLGIAETLKLLAECGGLPTYIPADPERCASLKNIISRHSIELLSSNAPGETIDLPKDDKIRLQLRNYYILNEINSGRSTGRAQAKLHNLTYRHIKIIKAKAKEENPNADFFPLDDIEQIEHS